MERTQSEATKTVRDLETKIAIKFPFGVCAEAILYRMTQLAMKP